jgi:hypothetical protein
VGITRLFFVFTAKNMGIYLWITLGITLWITLWITIIQYKRHYVNLSIAIRNSGLISYSY